MVKEYEDQKDKKDKKDKKKELHCYIIIREDFMHI